MYKIELTKEELDLINMAIMELPFRLAAPLIKKIGDQLKSVDLKTNKT